MWNTNDLYKRRAMDASLDSISIPIATLPSTPPRNIMASSPMAISPSSSRSSAYTPSPTDSVSSWSSTSSRRSSTSSLDYSSRCAFPCWPMGPSLSSAFERSTLATMSSSSSFSSSGVPSSYLSDEDLLPEGTTDLFANGAPPPPREASAYLDMKAPVFRPKPLPPLVAERPKKPSTRRRRSSKKVAKSSNSMAPISEALED